MQEQFLDTTDALSPEANSSEIVVFCGRRNKIDVSRMPASWMISFREFLDKMPVPGYLFDPESRHFVAANQSFCDLVGYPEPELIELELPLIMADEGETVRANEEISGRQEDVFRVNDFAFRRKDGTRVDTHIQYRVMCVVDGESTHRHMYFAAVVSLQAERRSTGLINLLMVAAPKIAIAGSAPTLTIVATSRSNSSSSDSVIVHVNCVGSGCLP